MFIVKKCNRTSREMIFKKTRNIRISKRSFKILSKKNRIKFGR